LSSLCVLIISPLFDVQLTKIFSHSVCGLFNLDHFFSYAEPF
jgi:hypothetical protein